MSSKNTGRSQAWFGRRDKMGYSYRAFLKNSGAPQGQLREEAAAAYARWLALFSYENRQCGLQASKILIKEGRTIGSVAVRHPLQKVHPETRAGLIEIARQLDPVVLRWGH